MTFPAIPSENEGASEVRLWEPSFHLRKELNHAVVVRAAGISTGLGPLVGRRLCPRKWLEALVSQKSPDPGSGRLGVVPPWGSDGHVWQMVVVPGVECRLCESDGLEVQTRRPVVVAGSLTWLAKGQTVVSSREGGVWSRVLEGDPGVQKSVVVRHQAPPGVQVRCGGRSEEHSSPRSAGCMATTGHGFRGNPRPQGGPSNSAV